MISDAIALYEFLSKHKSELDTKSALFSWDGTRISGHEELNVNIIRAGSTHWFYKVDEIEDYEFIVLPVIPALHMDFGIEDGSNPDARIFRFVATPLSTVMSGGGAKNVKCNFTVVAYKPSDLLSIREGM